MIEFVQRRPLLTAIVGVLILALVFSSFPIVPETEQAVVVSFGKPVRVLNRYQPGRPIGAAPGAGFELAAELSRPRGGCRSRPG